MVGIICPLWLEYLGLTELPNSGGAKARTSSNGSSAVHRVYIVDQGYVFKEAVNFLAVQRRKGINYFIYIYDTYVKYLDVGIWVSAI